MPLGKGVAIPCEASLAEKGRKTGKFSNHIGSVCLMYLSSNFTPQKMPTKQKLINLLYF
jgi:hypothetical protein